MTTKPIIKIAPGGTMTGAAGEMVTWKANNSVRVSIQTTDLATASDVLSNAVAQVLGLVPSMYPLSYFEKTPWRGDLEDFYVINVSISQPRREEDPVIGGSQGRLETQPLDLEDEDDEDAEGEET